MPRALLIAGNSRRFLDDVWHLRSYLYGEVQVRDFRSLRTAYLTEEEAAAWLEIELLAAPEQPLVVLFSGHGGVAGWSLNDNEEFPYARLAGIVARRKAPTVVINDCCHAHAAALAFAGAGVPEETVTLLSAAGADETTRCGLTAHVVNDWRAGRPHAAHSHIIVRERPVRRPSMFARMKDVLARGLVAVLHALLPKRFPLRGDIRAWEIVAPTEDGPPIDEIEARWGGELDAHFFPKPAKPEQARTPAPGQTEADD